MFFRLLLIASFLSPFLGDADLYAASKKKKIVRKVKLDKTTKKIKSKQTEQQVAEKPVAVEAKDGFAAPYILLIDEETGSVLYERDADVLIEPASMTKMLTAYIVIERLAKKMLDETTLFTISKNAYRQEGSTSFLNLNDQVKVIDLLRGLIIQSGNDAAMALAEGVAGTEQAFAELMNKKAQELGMQNSTFANASGLPHPNQRTTARDLVILGQRLRKDFPAYYGLWSEKDFEHAGAVQANRNPLLGMPDMGCDGIKTGHTNSSGYGITATCLQKDRRLFAVIHGLKSANQRATEIKNLMNFGFNIFDNYRFFKENHVVDQIPVWYGKQSSIKIGFQKAVTLTQRRFDQVQARVEASYTLSLKAPLHKGDEVGKMTISLPNSKEPVNIPIVCLEDIPEAGFFGRVYDGLIHLFGGRSYCDKYKKITPFEEVK